MESKFARPGLTELLKNIATRGSFRVQREFQTLLAEPGGDLRSQKIAGVMIDVAAFVCMRNEDIGSKGANGLAKSGEGLSQFQEKVLILKVGSVLPEQALEGTVCDCSQRSRSLAETLGGIILERAEFSLESIVRSSAICSEDHERGGRALQESAAGDGFVVGMSDEDEDSAERR
jgi:hypothetical protein